MTDGFPSGLIIVFLVETKPVSSQIMSPEKTHSFAKVNGETLENSTVRNKVDES